MELHKISKEELTKIISEQEQLTAIVNNHIVKSDVHQAIYFENNLLGIKPIDREETEQVFVLDYDILYEAAEEMFKELEIGDEEIIYSTNNNSFAIYFRGKLKLEKEFKYQKSLFNYSDNTQNIEFEPAIAITNGYDYNNKITIFLLAIPKSGINNGFIVLNWNKINKITEHRLSKAYNNTNKKQILQDFYRPKILENFKNYFDMFLEHEKKLKDIKVSEIELIAVAFNIYSNLKNEQTIKSDDKTRRDLVYFLRKCEKYFNEKENLRSLLFFIGHNSINFSNKGINYSYFDEALHKKKAFSNLINRTLEGKNEDEKELRIFISEQVKSFKEILPLIK